MSTRTGLGIDEASPPFDQLTSIQRLAAARSGHHSPDTPGTSYTWRARNETR